MKLVSKKWQQIKDDKVATEKYEYLSLRDREAYSDLCSFWTKLKAEAEVAQEENCGGNTNLRSKRANRGINRFNRDLGDNSLQK